MAFVKGIEVTHTCPICGIKVSWEPTGLSFLYKHPIDGIYTINGYPTPCTNNGELLKQSQVKTHNAVVIDRKYFSESTPPGFIKIIDDNFWELS